MIEVDIPPKIWRTITLGDLSTLVQYGFTATASKENEGIFYLRISDIDVNGHVALDSPRFVPRDTPDLFKYLLEPGDIVIARSGSVGRSFLFQGSDAPWVFASYLIRFRINKDLAEPEYIAWFQQSPMYWHYVDSMSRAVAQPNINSKELSRLPVPLPPLPEQRRIVAILRRADVLRHLRRQTNERARDLLPALFYEIFGDPRSWEDTEPLSNFVTFVGGGTPSRKIDRYFEGDIPWATSKDIKTRYLDDAQEHITEEAIHNSATKSAPTGTILMVVKSKILAHSLPMAIITRPFCFGQDLKGLVCNEGIQPQFIYSALAAQASSLLQQARGVNTEGITLEMLRDIPIPRPQKGQQEEFVRQIKVYDEILTYQRRSEQVVFDFLQSLLARAFSGELTAAWREAHEADLANEAAERDRQLAAVIRSPREAATDLSTEVGQEAFAATMDEVIGPSTQQLLKNLGSTAALVANLQEDPFAQLSRQLQQAAQINATLVNAELFRSVGQLAQETQAALAQTVAPIRQIQASFARLTDTLDATQRAVQGINLAWSLRLAETAAALVRRPNPNHPRFGLLRDIGEDQYLTYVAVHRAGRYATAETLA